MHHFMRGHQIDGTEASFSHGVVASEVKIEIFNGVKLKVNKQDMTCGVILCQIGCISIMLRRSHTIAPNWEEMTRSAIHDRHTERRIGTDIHEVVPCRKCCLGGSSDKDVNAQSHLVAFPFVGIEFIVLLIMIGSLEINREFGCLEQ